MLTSLSTCWDFVLVEPVQILGMLSGFVSYMGISSVMSGRGCFSESSVISSSYNTSTSSVWILEPQGVGCCTHSSSNKQTRWEKGDSHLSDCTLTLYHSFPKLKGFFPHQFSPFILSSGVLVVLMDPITWHGIVFKSPTLILYIIEINILSWIPSKCLLLYLPDYSP